MKQILSLFGKEFHVPKFRGITNVIKSFSLTEKIIFGIFALLCIGTSLTMLVRVNQNFTVEIPRYGGTYTEGTIGTPRFINPLLAQSETDRDLVALVYSGLMRQSPDGTLIPDLAESYEISEDGLSYFFTIRADAEFHDGKPVTSDDVIYTVATAQDAAVKSPKRANWDGITVERITEKELVFHLQQPYAPFLNNTTLGILPKHIWQGVDTEEFAFSQLNTEPIGSGPYKVQKILRDKSGIAETYELRAFSDFALGRPHIKNIHVSFYRNEEDVLRALGEKEIGAVSSISPERAKERENTAHIERVPLPRLFAVFFNQSKAPVLLDTTVREALSVAIDREAIIDDVLSGYGIAINGPIPPILSPFETLTAQAGDATSNETHVTPSGLEAARAMLADAGWKANDAGVLANGKETLTFSISTADVPELVAVAEKVTETWRALGADVSVKIFSPNDLNQNVIRPRKYDALLFGEVIGRDLDFYAFWHSSQRNDPGLNVADYANITVDQALTKARGLGDSPERDEALRTFEQAIIKDTPAAFLYSPEFIYLVPRTLHGDIPQNITIPADRFGNVHEWYLETDRVWKIFNK